VLLSERDTAAQEEGDIGFLFLCDEQQSTATATCICGDRGENNSLGDKKGVEDHNCGGDDDGVKEGEQVAEAE
jgi:hypothetical protein